MASINVASIAKKLIDIVSEHKLDTTEQVLLEDDIKKLLSMVDKPDKFQEKLLRLTTLQKRILKKHGIDIS